MRKVIITSLAGIGFLGSALLGATWSHVRPTCIVAKVGTTILIPANAPAEVQPNTCYWLENHATHTELLARMQ